MEKYKAEELLARYISGECTPEERMLVEAGFLSDFKNGYQQVSSSEIEDSCQRIKNVVTSHMAKDRVKPGFIKLWSHVGVAAAVLTIISFGIFFFLNDKSGGTDLRMEALNDINPGKTGATLLLASGKKVSLVDVGSGQIARESGVRISKNTKGQLVYEIINDKSIPGTFNTLYTSNGETYMVVLPDQSKIWLNAASSLTYHTSLIEGGFRRVRLDGEAYFEISKDQKHPFIVESGNQRVKVLGTHFNVKAYRDESISRTTLIEGSVEVADTRFTTVLKPDEVAVNKDGMIKIQKADPELAIAWKNDKFIFERLPVTEIMKMIERWYDVEIIYQGEIPTVKFLGSVSRFEKASQVLKALESTGHIHFEIKGKKIFVSKP